MATPSTMGYPGANKASVTLSSAASIRPELNATANVDGGRNEHRSSSPQVSGTALR
jgi:hypothetical protein